jgi:tripartite-type tricarboxylate transporter receptor subunit TctC
MTRARLPRRLLFALPAIGLAHRGDASPTLDRTARIVVGAGPGGGTDTVARLFAERLSGRYAPQVIVENRPGASGRARRRHPADLPDAGAGAVSAHPAAHHAL